jgi:hypothetical protein
MLAATTARKKKKKKMTNAKSPTGDAMDEEEWRGAIIKGIGNLEWRYDKDGIYG